MVIIMIIDNNNVITSMTCTNVRIQAQKPFGKKMRGQDCEKSDRNKGIASTMPITITSEINPILHCVFG